MRIAAAIHGAVESARPRPRYAVGDMAGLLVALNRFLPAWLFGQVATSQIT